MTNKSACIKPGMQVLITGASSGIGRQLAIDFAKAGADVWLLARNRERLAAIQQECLQHNVLAHIIAIDLADPEAVKTVIPTIQQQAARLDIIINNAAIPCHYAWQNITTSFWNKVLEVNLRAPIALTLAALPLLETSKGQVINISSMAGLMVPPREMIYSAGKFGLSAFSEGLSLELEKKQTSCSVIFVGPIDTPIWDKMQQQDGISYNGTKYPPSIVSKAVMHCLRTRKREYFAPASMRLIILFKRCFPRLFRRLLLRWDNKNQLV